MNDIEKKKAEIRRLQKEVEEAERLPKERTLAEAEAEIASLKRLVQALKAERDACRAHAVELGGGSTSGGGHADYCRKCDSRGTR